MNKFTRILTYLVLLIAAFISVFPLFWMVVSATNTSVDVTAGTLLPGRYLLENLQNLFQNTDMTRAIINSTIISIVTTTLALLISSLAGYGFEIYQSKAKDRVFNFLLLSMMIPFSALMVPLFGMFANISEVFPAIGLNTYASIILPSIATAFLIFYFRQSTKMFSKEIIEAARIDGLSEFGIFLRIYVPTMKTTYAAAAIITFMSSWNNYLWPLISVQTPEMQTVPLVVSSLGASYAPDYGLMMAGMLISMLPIAIVFFVLQKHFVAGMTGSIK